jgi:fatty acid-binding protein DegV
VLFAKIKDTATDVSEQVVFISHGDCIEDAKYLAEKIKSELGVKEVIISYVGPVIGAHSGPGTLALFFMATKR